MEATHEQKLGAEVSTFCRRSPLVGSATPIEHGVSVDYVAIQSILGFRWEATAIWVRSSFWSE